MFYEADPDNPGQFTKLGLRDDPEPALQRALRRAREETHLEGFSRLLGGIGLIVVLVLLYVVFNDYLAQKQDLPGLIARGRRIPAQLSGAPVHVGGRYRYTPVWPSSTRIR